MAKYAVKTFNTISQIGIDKFSKDYDVKPDTASPDAIMLRSYNLHDESLPGSVLAVGRAGAGTNNIPVGVLADKGIVVFNAPGANANSVKELVLAGMLLSARNIPNAVDYVKGLDSDDMKKAVEAGKKKFAGSELAGKTLGVIGLGAIGYRVANTATELGMKVLGYDPAMTIKNAWQLSPVVDKVEYLDSLLEQSDFVTIHVPLLDATRGLLSAEKLKKMKKSAILLNFSRDELVDELELIKMLDSGKLNQYVTDFPNKLTHAHPKVIALPHLGASTEEAEDSCAIMIANQLQDYLENGNIRNSVNFPEARLPKKGDKRITLAHKNEAGVVAQITQILGGSNINIVELLNKSRGELAYTIIDIDSKDLPKKVITDLQKIPQLLKLRVI
ncbi:3-phosphoglycerate dehydrogenase [Candidatus Saccharibacteria bacterium RIFCSPHIGHO2_12_FULL_41_12]|nr:MAG: 3-phosphoglycerate dehydrogenase [Candidatus Saccharibacteria bacterium RIFCSPHIGHO2_12_FULL_41_12]